MQFFDKNRKLRRAKYLMCAAIVAAGGVTGCGTSSGAITAGEDSTEYDFSLFGKDKDESGSADEESSSTDSFDEDSKSVQKKTNEIEKLIDKYFYFDQDEDKREESYYDGIMRGLDDPYSVYYTEEEFKKLQEDDSGEFEGYLRGRRDTYAVDRGSDDYRGCLHHGLFVADLRVFPAEQAAGLLCV
jgi:carboxyl-terminal processing protease